MAILNLDNTKKRERISAIALEYNPEKGNAPKLTAKGFGPVAEEIIRIAKENNIKVVEDSNILEMLIPLELDDEIPTELYGVVAELLAFVYKMNDTVKV